MKFSITLLTILPISIWCQTLSQKELKLFEPVSGEFSIGYSSGSPMEFKIKIDLSASTRLFRFTGYTLEQKEEFELISNDFNFFGVPTDPSIDELYKESGAMIGLIYHSKPFQIYAQIGAGYYESIEEGKCLHRDSSRWGSGKCYEYDEIRDYGFALPVRVGMRCVAWSILGFGIEYHRNVRVNSKFGQVAAIISVGFTRWPKKPNP